MEPLKQRLPLFSPAESLDAPDIFRFTSASSTGRRVRQPNQFTDGNSLQAPRSGSRIMSARVRSQ